MTSPSVIVSNPPANWSSVVFPEPDGPSIAMSEPTGSLKETLFNAVTSISPSLYFFVRFLTSSMFCMRKSKNLDAGNIFELW